MAVGDDALAAGIELTPGTAPASDIDLWINKLADEVARRTMATLTVARGGTGATNAASARSNLGFPALGAPDQAAPNQLPVYNGSGQLTTVDPTAGGHAASKQYVDIVAGSAQNRADDAWNRANNAQGRADEGNANGIAARQGNLYQDSYNRQLGGTRRTAWLQDNGQLGYAASSERYKKFIRPEEVTDEQVLMLSLVSYQWKAAVAVDDRREMGLIAERVVEAGLSWAAFYNADGSVEGLNYEMVALAMLPAVQRLIARTHRIEDRLEALEAPRSTPKDPS